MTAVGLAVFALLVAFAITYVLMIAHDDDTVFVARFDRWRHERREVKRLRAADRLAAEGRALDMVRGFRAYDFDHPTMRSHDDEVA